MTRSDDETLVRAAISFGDYIPRELAERLGDHRTFALLSAATVKAVERKFPNGLNPAEMQEFVMDLKRRFSAGASQIKPLVAEAVIRASQGEDQLLEGLGIDDVRTMLCLMPYAIMTHENLQGEELTQYIDQVIKMADTGGADDD